MKTSYSKIAILSFILLTGISKNLVSQTNPAPLVRLSINTPSFNDETVFYFQQGGTTSFQSDFDAYKLIANPNFPYIGSMSDSILTSISGLPELTSNISVPVKAITSASGTFTFTSLTENFPTDVCVTLFDALTGTSTNILTSEYVCTLYDTTSIARFTMNFFTTSLNAVSQVKQADCKSAGIISAQGLTAGPWNYEWKSGDSIVKISLNKTTADTLANLTGGNYSLKISTTGQCTSFSKSFVINNALAPKADFTADVFATALSNSGRVNFTNTSENAQFNVWEFGDNSGSFYVPSPSYNYLSAGVYTVTLISESITHCKDTAKKVITVVNDITGINELANKERVLLATSSQGQYELMASFDMPTALNVTLLDLNGNLLKNYALEQALQTKTSVSLDGFSTGMYLLKVTSNNGSERTFKLLK